MKLFFSVLLTLLGSSLLAQVNETALRNGLAEAAKQHRLSTQDIEGYFVTANYTQAGNGHAYFTQTAYGHEIFNAILQVHVSANGSVYTNSRFVTDKLAKTNAATPTLDARTALDKAAEALHVSLAGETLKIVPQEHPDRVWFSNETLFRNPVRSTLGYEHVGERLLLAYKLIVEPRGASDMWNIRVDALTGTVIRVDNRALECAGSHLHGNTTAASRTILETEDCDAPEKIMSTASYRAYALGIESPLYGNRSLLTGVESLAASPFGWHDDNGVTGEEYTITRGNNVYAYEDQQNLNIPGYSPDAGTSLMFDYPLNFSLTPQQNMDAALTNLFVWNNFMHDVTYHYGFDEVSGNFQANNYGNGGTEGDCVDAQGFDISGINNANFATPEDGFNPTMQMYLWHHDVGTLTINSPPSIAGTYQTRGATFGLQPPFMTTTANLTTMMGAMPHVYQGCGFISNTAILNGKIATAYRGIDCSYVEKAQNAQNAGAIALVVINDQGTVPTSIGGDDFGTVTIPVVGISKADGDLIRTYTNAYGSIEGATQELIYDCNFDNQVICHEYGHGISNRLTGGPMNVDCLDNEEQPGEGWSDFFAMVMTDIPGSNANQVRGIGNYAYGDSATGWGVRNYPYTCDMAVNPLTYGDINDLGRKHGAGTLWCTMLWDLYWDMIAQYGHTYDLYDSTGGNNMAIYLVMEGMRLQPCQPGFVDARDAILQADQMLYGGANQCLIWKTFARRGLGYSASQGSSLDLGDETEAFDLYPGCSEVNDVNFSATPTLICGGQSVTFQSQILPLPTSYNWSFPGGTPPTSTDVTPTIIYEEAGDYPVTLSVVNANGTQNHTAPSYIIVSPDIAFTLQVTYGAFGYAIAGTVVVTEGIGPFSYAWSSSPQVNYFRAGLGFGLNTVTVSNEAGCSTTQSFIVTGLDIEDVYKNSSLSVFPNPAQNFVTITTNDPILQIKLTDISGKIIRNTTINNLQTNLDISDLAHGTYLIHIQTTSHSFSRKIIKI